MIYVLFLFFILSYWCSLNCSSINYFQSYFFLFWNTTVAIWTVRECGATFLTTETKDWCGWWTSRTSETLIGYTVLCAVMYSILIYYIFNYKSILTMSAANKTKIINSYRSLTFWTIKINKRIWNIFVYFWNW